MVSIRYKLVWDGYATAGFAPPFQKIKPKQVGALVATARAMADTGCSSMVAGPDFYTNLGLSKNDLIPVKTIVRAANRTVIDIVGAVIVDIRLNAAGSERMTKQVVYISEMATKPYLNLEVCKHLGLA